MYGENLVATQSAEMQLENLKDTTWTRLMEISEGSHPELQEYVDKLTQRSKAFHKCAQSPNGCFKMVQPREAYYQYWKPRGKVFNKIGLGRSFKVQSEAPLDKIKTVKEQFQHPFQPDREDMQGDVEYNPQFAGGACSGGCGCSGG